MIAGNFTQHARPQKNPEIMERRIMETPEFSRTIQAARAATHKDASGTSFNGAIMPQFTIGDERMISAAIIDRLEPTSGSAKSAVEHANDMPNQNEMDRVATGPRNFKTTAWSDSTSKG